ncbi:MAG: TOMM precursor leader peptide-binding protein [Cyanobacteria bacterium P01_A01_bin.17]
MFLRSERQKTILNEPLYAQLLPLLEAGCSTDEMVERLQTKLPSAHVYYGLTQLQQQGYLQTVETQLSPSLAIICNHLNVDLDIAFTRLQTTQVGVRSVGSVATSGLIAMLEAHQIQVVRRLERAVGSAVDSTTSASSANSRGRSTDLEIVLCDDYLQLALGELNQVAQESSRPWLLVKPLGTVLWLGPLFYPGRTGCWECLAQRLRGNRPDEAYLARQTHAIAPLTPPLSQMPAVIQTAFGLITTEVFKWIVQDRDNNCLEGQLLTHDTLTLETEYHHLTRRPQCQCCDHPGGKAQTASETALPPILGRRRKGFTSDGGHRCHPPETILKKYQQHISPITGVVRSLHKLPPGLNELQHNYVAKHHFLSMFDDLRALGENIGGRSGGKGKTDAQAKMSALGEAVERYSGVFQGDEPRITDSYQNLGELAIHPNTCMQFSQAQYAGREAWNAQCEKHFHRVPAPFDQTREIEWTLVWSLTEETFKYLPTAYCYFGYPASSRPDCWADCWADTNGCAAGSTLEEAILQGFMELVERDSVALWWYNRLSKPRVDLDSFADPYFQALQQAYGAIDRQLWVLDITSDLNIPSFVAVSRCCDRASTRHSDDIILGFGTHFDARLAISRALTEVNQLLPAVLSTHADGTTRYADSADAFTLNWWQTATLANQPYLVPKTDSSPKQLTDYPNRWSDDLLDDIQHCQRIVEQKGLEMLVLDQTRPDIGLNVVKVIVPGLRHYWKRLGPGRLYTVPVEMGWLTAPLSEPELNPLPLCL